MSNKISLSIQINPDLYTKIRSALGYCETMSRYEKGDFPITDEDIINSALYYYFEKLDTRMSYTNVNRRALKLAKDQKVKNRFKEILKRVGMKQKELAELTGIDEATISTMLANKNQPSIDYFLRIWSVLGCPPMEEVFYREKS